MAGSVEHSVSTLQFEDLPCELVGEILSFMPTKALVMASRTSKFIHEIATDIVNRRLRSALEVEGYQLIYECYEADDKNNHPYNHCEYKGTHARNPNRKPEHHQEEDIDFSPLRRLYTNFTPTPYDASVIGGISSRPASTNVTIDSGDLFTQVCASASLVRIATGNDSCRSVIPVFESFFRVRREWLDRASEGANDGGVVWVGMGENVGLKLQVGERKAIGGVNTAIRGRDEEPSVQYRMEYHSLVIRAAYLLQAIEKRKHASYIQAINLSPHVAMPALEASVLAY